MKATEDVIVLLLAITLGVVLALLLLAQMRPPVDVAQLERAEMEVDALRYRIELLEKAICPGQLREANQWDAGPDKTALLVVCTGGG